MRLEEYIYRSTKEGFEEGYKIGFEEGYKIGFKEGIIIGAIENLMEFGKSDEEIAGYLMKKFLADKETACEYIDKYRPKEIV